MTLKILVVTAMYPHPENQGNGAFVMQQVERLRMLGHQVDVFHFKGYRSKSEYIKAALEIRRVTGEQSYDIVHAHYGVTGLPALFRVRTPLVVTLHGSDALLGWFEPLISRLVCRFADATIVVSSKIAERIPGEVIPCGVDFDAFEPKDKAMARARLGLAADRKYVLFPFDPSRKVKRFDLATAAVERLRNDGVELLVVSKVHNSEMPWYYSAADVMLLCSDSEGSPTAVKEALACNLPVVTTDVGDVTEIVAGIEGVQICEQNAAALAEGVRAILERPELKLRSRSVIERYSQGRVIEAILRVYERVLQERPVCNRGRSVAAPSATR